MAVAACYDRVAVLSEDAKLHYSKWIPEEKLRVCYNGVDVSRELSETMKASLAHDCRRVEEFKGDSILIGCICELVKIKNLDVMLQAMALLPLEYKLLLIGSGADEKSLQEQADRLGISDRVLFLGYRYEAHRLLPLVDIYAMTSRSEGFCLALTEAAMYGKKIVCADIPGMREKFSEEEVTYFDVDSPQELAEAVLTANEHPEKGERAKAVAEERFSTERMYEGYEGVYARKV
jgi:glycosyltransferase involved in cell wall biosynthesis